METVMAAFSNIRPCLWFDCHAEEAAELYCSVFPNSKITNVTHFLNAGEEIHGRKAGSVMTVDFSLDGVPFAALNGGPMFKFSEAVSFMIDCRDQAEVDYYTDKLSGGGEINCGWLKDKFGVSWQVVPVRLEQLLADKDRAAAERVMNAMLEMGKIDIAKLEEAYRG
jgi:predicted 3-demethylubiquinone-9 3-methyltransferase (glyoxalase superfamily)